MPTLSALISAGSVCQCLRDKKMFYHSSEPLPGARDILPPATMPQGPFWCARTQTVTGPDGQLVHADQCRPGRSCCETT